MSIRRKILIGVIGLFSLLLLLFCLWVMLDKIHVNSCRSQATKIKIGDDKATIVSILGKPDGIYEKGSGLFDGQSILVFWKFLDSPERWAYGSAFDWEHYIQNEFPYFFPFCLRLFGPDADDVAIEFSDMGIVTKVTIPE